MTRLGNLTRQQSKSLIEIERLLMAPCCYTQTIDVHMSEIAQAMREDVTERVRRGQTNTDIFDHYKALYGEQILAVPDGRLGTAAFAVPATVSTFATGALAYVLYRLHHRKALMRDQELGTGNKRGSATVTSEKIETLRARIRAATEF